MTLYMFVLMSFAYNIQNHSHTQSREHEKVCEYAPVQCPNSSLCPRMIRKVHSALASMLQVLVL